MRLYAVLLLLFSSMLSYSQDCNATLYGTLLDVHDGSILSGATIVVAQTGTAVQTDLDGLFTITRLCNSTYQLQVSHPSCTTKAFSIRIQGDLQKTFKLEHHLEALNEIIVKGDAAKQTQTLYENKIDAETISQFSSGSLGDALNSLSGVSSLNTGNAVVKPMINGLHSSRIVLINNGVRMQDQEWGAEHAPSIDINSAGSIKVIKGAGALQYGGNAIGGVIITEAPKVPLLDSLYGKTTITGATNGRGGAVTSSLTKSYENGWYGTLQGTLKRFGDFEAPDYVLSNTGLFERNFSARFGINRIDYGLEAYYSYFRNEIGILRASHVGGAEDQVRAIASPEPLIIRDFTYDIGSPRQDVTHHLARIRGFKEVENLGRVTVQYDFQQNNRFEYDVRRGEDDQASVDLDLKTHTLGIDLKSTLSEKIKISTGISGEYQNNFANPETGVRRLIPDYDRYSVAAFFTGNYQMNEQWLLEAGARFDYTYMDALKFYRKSFWEARGYDTEFPDLVIQENGNQVLTNPKLSYYNPSFTIGSTYAFGEVYTLFANYSLASRAPNASELFSEGLHHSASRIELGDLRFDTEISHKVSLTLQRKEEKFDFAITPYSNTINNFILIEPTGIQQTIRGNFQVWEYRQTQAQLFGVDIDASIVLFDQVRFIHQFSLVKGYDRSQDESLINMPAVSTLNTIAYNNTNFRNLSIRLQSDYVFAQNEFPNNNFEVQLEETIETVDVSTPPDAYHLVHLNASIEALSNVYIGLNLHNIFNTSYRNYLNRLRYYADDIGRNISLQVKVNY
jgi:iron complex outermembrane receptor protein